MEVIIHPPALWRVALPYGKNEAVQTGLAGRLPKTLQAIIELTA